MGNLSRHGAGAKGSVSIERDRNLHPLLPLTYENAKSDEINELMRYVEVLLRLVATRLPGTNLGSLLSASVLLRGIESPESLKECRNC